MRMQESAENYLEMILMLKNKNGQVRSIDVANEMSFSKASVSVAMKSFRKDGYITVDADGYISLTDSGLAIAEKIYEIPFQEESSGTRKIFSCLARINKCLQKGSVLIADELDAKLHPKLLRFIIELFTDTEKNKSGAQLLITSHDIVNMVREIFRRDEIWFCSLSPDNDSCLYSLISFKDERGKTPRKDAVYGKRYIEGLYGADQYIDKGLKWGD